jgi:hypothetical protein
MTMNKVIRLIIFLLLFIPTVAWGTTYFVSPASDATYPGDDADNGTTPALAVATIAKAHELAGSGDTISFNPRGTWTGTVILTAETGVAYIGNDTETWGSGTRAKFQATGSATAGVVRISASTVTFTGFDVDMNDQSAGGIYIGYGLSSSTTISNITVQDCLVHDSNVDAFAYGIYVGPLTSNTDITVSNVSILNNTVYNTQHEAIVIYPSWGDCGSGTPCNRKNDTILVRGNTIYNAGQNGGASCWYGDGILVNNDSDNVTIDHNVVHDSCFGVRVTTSSDNIPYGCLGGSANNLIVSNNIFYDNDYGVALTPACGMQGDGTFYNNVIVNSTTKDLSVANDTATLTWGTSAFSFYNNTFYNTYLSASDAKSVGFLEIYSGMTTVTGTPTFNFKNNIVYTATCNGIYDVQGILTHSYNLIYRSSAETHKHVSICAEPAYNCSVTDYDRDGTASDLQNWEATAQKTDPAFSGGTLPTGFSGTYGTNMVPNTDYFQLTVDSPAKDAGATLASYTGAINGAGLATPIVRPLGAAYDIGAYEYGTVAQSGGSAGSGFKFQGVTIR